MKTERVTPLPRSILNATPRQALEILKEQEGDVWGLVGSALQFFHEEEWKILRQRLHISVAPDYIEKYKRNAFNHALTELGKILNEAGIINVPIRDEEEESDEEETATEDPA